MASWAAGCYSGRAEVVDLQAAVPDLQVPLICEQGPGGVPTWEQPMAAHQEWVRAGLLPPTPAAGIGGP